MYFYYIVLYALYTHCYVSLQGSGKSTLSRALCGKAREHLDAHVEVVDCKKLQGQQMWLNLSCFSSHSFKFSLLTVNCLYLWNCVFFSFSGKRAETVRQMLQDIFEQAEWRQPSVVLLDDLDHVTGAPSSPEHEHGPEVVLQQHIAQSKPLMLHFFV